MKICTEYVQKYVQKGGKKGKRVENGKEWDREIEVSKGDRVDEKDIEKKMGRYERKENEKKRLKRRKKKIGKYKREHANIWNENEIKEPGSQINFNSYINRHKSIQKWARL